MRGVRGGVWTRRNLLESFESSCDPHLDFGWFVGTNSFLVAALWSQFPGPNRPHPPGPSTHWLQQFPGWPGGQRCGPSGVPDPFQGGLSHASLRANAGRRRCTRAPSQQPAPATTPRSPTCRSPGTPAPPRPAPRLASWKSRIRGASSNGAAGNWPLYFLRPDPGWGRPVGGAGKRGLPPSCFRPGGELRVGVRIRGPRRDVGEAGDSCCGVFALVPSRGGHGTGDVRWRARPRISRDRPLRRARARERGSRGRGPQGPAAGWGNGGGLSRGEREGAEVRMAVKCPPSQLLARVSSGDQAWSTPFGRRKIYRI